jgi:hypothetical protein
MPEKLEAISFTDNWRSTLSDPSRSLWRFAADIGHDPISRNVMKYGPRTSRFKNPVSLGSQIEEISHLASYKEVAAVCLVEAIDPGKDDRTKIAGIAIATPDQYLQYDGYLRSERQPQPLMLPLTRIELVTTGGDEFAKAASLLAKVSSVAMELFPEQAQVVLAPRTSEDPAYGQSLAGIGTVLPFKVGVGSFGWEGHDRPDVIGQSQAISSHHRLD